MNDSLRRYSAEQVSHAPTATWLVLRNTAAMSFHVRVDDDAAKPSRLTSARHAPASCHSTTMGWCCNGRSRSPQRSQSRA